jgi:hypothetical protein
VLDLSRVQLGVAVLARIPRFIRLVPRIFDLNFYGNLIRDTGISRIVQILEQNPDVVGLNVGCNDLGERSVGCLLEILEHSNIVSLQLGTLDAVFHPNRITRDGLTKLLGQVSATNRLRALGLSGLGAMQQRKLQRYREFSKCVAECLTRCTALEVLDASCCGFGDGDQGALAGGFTLNANLRRLDLHGNAFRGGGARLMDGVAALSRLAALNLSGCCIDGAGAGVLAERLAGGWRLIRLDLSGNGIGSPGVARLLAAVGGSVHLTALSLARTACDAGIKEELQHCVHTNEVLEELDLSGNALGDCMHGVFDGCALASLALSGCRLSDRGGREVCAALAASDRIERLAMRDNFFTRDAGYEMLGLLQHNESLRRIDVASNHFDRFAIDGLNTVCSRNRSTRDHQVLGGMRSEYVHLSIQGAKIPGIAGRVARFRRDHAALLGEIEDLRAETDALEHHTGVALTSTDKTAIEFRSMMTSEEKIIADMQLRRRDVEAEFAETAKDLAAKCDAERRDFAALEAEAAAIERATADYVRDCEAAQAALREEIERCEAMLEEVTRAGRNRRRLREYEVPEYPYAEEEARRCAEREEALRLKIEIERERENEIFEGLGISPNGLGGGDKKTGKKGAARARKKNGG